MQSSVKFKFSMHKIIKNDSKLKKLRKKLNEKFFRKFSQLRFEPSSTASRAGTITFKLFINF